MLFTKKKIYRLMNTKYCAPTVDVMELELETGILGFSQGSEIITPMDFDYYEYEEIV